MLSDNSFLERVQIEREILSSVNTNANSEDLLVGLSMKTLESWHSKMLRNHNYNFVNNLYNSLVNISDTLNKLTSESNSVFDISDINETDVHNSIAELKLLLAENAI